MELNPLFLVLSTLCIQTSQISHESYTNLVLASMLAKDPVVSVLCGNQGLKPAEYPILTMGYFVYYLMVQTLNWNGKDLWLVVTL